MRYVLTITALALALSACSQLPKIWRPEPLATLPCQSVCRTLFPQGQWQIHHAIEATVPGGGKTLLTGVTVLSSRERSIHFALMSVEGFVLFSGRFDGHKLIVDRAVSPFDRPGFAQGLMDDLTLLLFAPQAPLCMPGRMDRQHRICRFCLPDKTVDIIVAEIEPSWEIRQYNQHRRLTRSIVAGSVMKTDGALFAKKLILKNHGLLGYQLVLNLLEAIPLKDKRNQQQ